MQAICGRKPNPRLQPPAVLPCPVHGPIWAQPQMDVILLYPCLPAPTTPLGETLTLLGDTKDGWNRTASVPRVPGHISALGVDFFLS